MSKQSEAKSRQGYTKTLNNCGNCRRFTCDKGLSTWGKDFVTERNLRCSIGGFKVNKTATCGEWERSDE